MRNLFAITTLLFSACNSGAMETADPPVLTVTSPLRSTMQADTSSVTVTGTVLPNDQGDAVKSVMVNNVAATLNPDGSFSASVQVLAGANLIKTVATDVKGGEADDTRALLSGTLEAPGTMIPSAITADISTEAFGKISTAAGTIVKGMDLMSMIAPLQPMQHAGDEDGPDCLYDELFVDNLTMSDLHISLVPVANGLSFSAEIDGPDVKSHANYAVACISGSNTVEVTADSVVVSGTLNVVPNGMNGFTTTLQNPDVQLNNLNVSASGLPGTILDMIDMNSAISYIVSKVAEAGMGPMMNTVLGGLAGPQKLDVMGKTLDVQVAASAVQFDDSSALVSLDTSMLIEGSESSPGFIFTANGTPTMSPGNGLQMGMADDLMNEMLAEFDAIGMLNLSMPSDGGTFDSVGMQMTLPPMISADPADGHMRIVLGDMTATFMNSGTAVAKAAINASLDLKIVPGPAGYSSVAVQLTNPVIAVNVLDGTANNTLFTNADLASAVSVSLGAQIDAISKLLTNVPLPSIAGLTVSDLSVSGDQGYIMVNGTLN